MEIPDLAAMTSQADQRRHAHHFVSSFLREIAPNACFNTQSVLASHPEVADSKSAILDLALEEFCRREMAGESLDPVRFAAQFPWHSASILHLLELRQLLEDNYGLPGSGSVKWPDLGDEFLGFILLDELGRGACSRVYLAAQVDIGERLVVLKVTPNHIAEVNTLGRLSHPHIVPIHSVQFDKDAGLSAICMPFLGHATLLDLLLSIRSLGKMPLRVSEVQKFRESPWAELASQTQFMHELPENYVDFVVDIASQVAAALEFTHAQGYCHYDIKPTNVLLALDGSVRLIDFNLAVLATHQRSAGGTIPYMAPEQLHRHLHQPQEHSEGPKSDVYALGIVLFELLTGHYPFGSFSADEDRLAAAARLLERQQTTPLSVRRWNPNVDRHLESLVLRCLTFDSRTRPDSAELHAGLTISGTRGKRLARWMLRHRNKLRWAAVAAAFLAATTVWITAHREPPVVRALRNASIHQRQGDLAGAEQELGRAIAIDPLISESWFARGLCRLAMKKHEEAYADFLESRRLSHDAKSAAYAGYCLCLAQRDWIAAISLLEEARANGIHHAGLANDLAYCYLKVREFDKAEQCINSCMTETPVAGASCFILAKLQHGSAVRAMNSPDKTGAVSLFQAAHDSILQAVDLGFENADVYLDLAQTEVCLARETNDSVASVGVRISETLRNACRFQIDPTRFHEIQELLEQFPGQFETPPSDIGMQRSAALPPVQPLLDPLWPTQSAATSVATR